MRRTLFFFAASRTRQYLAPAHELCQASHRKAHIGFISVFIHNQLSFKLEQH